MDTIHKIIREYPDFLNGNEKRRSILSSVFIAFGEQKILPESVRILLECGADVNVWETPHAFAFYYRNENVGPSHPITDMLAAAGANYNAKDSVGRVPLHCAVMVHNASLCQEFIDEGADVWHENMENKTPLACLLSMCYDDITYHKAYKIVQQRYLPIIAILLAAGSSVSQIYSRTHSQLLSRMLSEPMGVVIKKEVREQGWRRRMHAVAAYNAFNEWRHTATVAALAHK